MQGRPEYLKQVCIYGIHFRTMIMMRMNVTLPTYIGLYTTAPGHESGPRRPIPVYCNQPIIAYIHAWLITVDLPGDNPMHVHIIYIVVL